jgi:hypothetical protein
VGSGGKAIAHRAKKVDSWRCGGPGRGGPESGSEGRRNPAQESPPRGTAAGSPPVLAKKGARRGEAAGPAVGAFPALASVKHSRRSLLAASLLEGTSEPRNDATKAKRTDPPRRSGVRVEEDRRREALSLRRRATRCGSAGCRAGGCWLRCTPAGRHVRSRRADRPRDRVVPGSTRAAKQQPNPVGPRHTGTGRRSTPAGCRSSGASAENVGCLGCRRQPGRANLRLNLQLALCFSGQRRDFARKNCDPESAAWLPACRRTRGGAAAAVATTGPST